MTTTTPSTRKQSSDGDSRILKLGAVGGDFLDQRLSGAGFVKFFARKVFPDHWSFMFGEMALYSFVILLISGVFLTLFFYYSIV